MLGYNPEEKKVEEAIQQVYRDFALKYDEIQKSELSESEKQAQIRELLERTSKTEAILRKTRSLAELSDEDKEALGIREKSEIVVDEKVVDTLVSIYAQRAKTPNTRNRNMGVVKALTLSENETLEEIDTTAFEEELRQYFTEHYADLLSDGYNDFLSQITEVLGDIYNLHNKNKYGDLTQIAMKRNIEPEKFKYFGHQLTVQDGLVAEEDLALGESKVLYATPEGINKRIFDLYSKALYREQKNNGRDFFSDDIRKLRNTYITYAEKNGIEIENSEVLETLDVDMAKVQALAKYINRVVNSRDNIEKGDYTQLFSDDIIKNYSKIMNLQWYRFDDLESVKGIVGENAYIDGLDLELEEDSITCPDEFRPDIAYATPEYLKSQYESVMAKIKELHSNNAFILDSNSDILKVNKEKQALRRYIQENGIEGIDISIPQVEIDSDKTNMIADAIMEQYGAEYEEKESMRARILSKLEDNWSEIVTEYQCMDVDDLFKDELKEMGYTYADETLYVKDDFIYLGDYINFGARCIYATPEALKNNISALDNKISSRDICLDEERARKILEQYAKEQGIDLDIPDVETVKARRQREKEMFSFRGGFGRFGTEFMPDDPTARPKLDLNDTMIDTIMKMADGNPGAIVGLTSMLKADKTGGLLLLDLDDMNIRGSQIWEAYKYLYNGDGEKFAEAVSKRDPKMVDFINQELASVGGEKAVTGGASFDRHKTPDKYRFTEEEVEQLKQQRKERIAKEKEQRKKMLANSPAKKNRVAKKIAERQAKRQEYRQRLIAMGKKSLGELDEELTGLQEKEQQAKKLCEQYERQLPDKSHQEI